MIGLRVRTLLTLGLLAGGQVITGCEGQFPGDVGFSGVRAELDRTKPYHLVALSEGRAVISAKGRQVAIEPAEGFCLAADSVETSERSAFALIGDCALGKAPDKSKRSARGELKLPHAVPGIITVSLSGNPQLEGAEGLDGLESFLKTRAGRSLLGRGDDPAGVDIKETRQLGESVFVLVEDQGEGVLPVLSKRFWRGFVELNDRLAVVTVSGFRANPLGKEEMLEYLVDQVKTLAVANRNPVDEPYQSLLAARAASRASREQRADAGTVALSEVKPEPLEVVIVQDEETPEIPMPRQRPAVPQEAEDARDVERPDEPVADDAEKETQLVAALPQAKPDERVSREDAAQNAAAEPTAAPDAQRVANPVALSSDQVTLVNPAGRLGLDDGRGRDENGVLATASQAFAPLARPGESIGQDAGEATRYAPRRAPTAPKRPAV